VERMVGLKEGRKEIFLRG